MVSWGDIGTVALDYAQENYVFVIAVIVIIGFFVRKKIKSNKTKKAAEIDALPVPTPERPEEMEPKPVEQEPIADEGSLANLFGESPSFSQSQNENVIARINNLSGDITKEGYDMDEKLRNDFDRLRAELVNTHAKREQIKKHGLKMSELYDKFGQREGHLTHQLANIEHVLMGKNAKR